MCLSGHREFRSSMSEAVMLEREIRGQIRSRSRTGPDNTVSRNFPQNELFDVTCDPLADLPRQARRLGRQKKEIPLTLVFWKKSLRASFRVT